jgi:hypothetical protein
MSEIIQNPDGYSVADDGTLPSSPPPAGIAISGLENATGFLRIARVDAAGALITTGGTSGGGVPVPNRSGWINLATAPGAGVPAQLSTFSIPDGFALVLKNRSTNTQGTVLLVATSTLHLASVTNRTELLVGESMSLYIDNMDLVFFQLNTDQYMERWVES